MKYKLLLTLPIAVILCASLVACGNNNNETEPLTTGETQTTSDWLDIEEETGDTLPNIDTLTYTEFKNMPAEQQQEVMNTFESTDGFFAWYNEKVQDYQEYVEQQKNPTEDPNDETTETTSSSEASDSTESTIIDSGILEIDRDTYLEFSALNGDEQLKIINSFESYDAFFVWYNTAKQVYLDSMIEIDGSTPIDLDDLIGATNGGN